MKRTQLMKRKVLGFVVALSMAVTGLVGANNIAETSLEAQAASKLKVNLANNQEMWVVDGMGERVVVRATAGAAGPIKCTSSNPSVVSADSNVLTAEKAGKAKITVKSGKRKVTRNIVVKNFKNESAIMSLKGFQRESDRCASVIVKNKTNRPFVATIRFKGYGENWDSVYEDPGECYVSLKAKGEQKVYFMASEEIEHIKLAVTGGTYIHQVGNNSTKVDAELSLEVLDDYLRYKLENKSDKTVYGAYSKLEYDSEGKLYKVNNYLLHNGEGYGKGEQSWGCFEGANMVFYDLIYADGTVWYI